MYEKDGKYYTEQEFLELNPSYTLDYNSGELKYKNSKGEDETTKDLPSGWTLYESGELIDFITN